MYVLFIFSLQDIRPSPDVAMHLFFRQQNKLNTIIVFALSRFLL